MSRYESSKKRQKMNEPSEPASSSIEQISQSISQRLKVPDGNCLIIKKNANVKRTLDRLLQILAGGDDSIVLTSQNENIQKMFTVLEIVKQKALQNKDNSDTTIGDSSVTLEFVEYHQYNKLDYLRILKPDRAPSRDLEVVDDASRRSEIMNNPLTKQDKGLLEVDKPISVPILTVYLRFARPGSSISQDQGLIMNGWSFQKS